MAKADKIAKALYDRKKAQEAKKLENGRGKATSR